MAALEALVRLHADIIRRLMEEIAKARGTPDLAAQADAIQSAIADGAARLCEAWAANPGRREKGPGDSPILRLVARQYEIAMAISEAEEKQALMNEPPDIPPPSPRRH